MLADPGCSDRQRRLAANEDAAASIFNGLAAGDLESAIRWQLWLGEHVVPNERALELIDPEATPIAASEYGNVDPRQRVDWVALEGGDVLGVSTFGVYWLVPADDALPQVVLDWPAARPTTPRSFCCAAPVDVRLPLSTRQLRELRIDEEVDETSVARVAIAPERICGLCLSVLPNGR